MEKDSFIFEEQKCGYLITEERKKMWKIELDMLDQVTRICDENGLKYSLIYGSAIGAMRHHGFIPWDDDIDLCMVREDFDKFIQIAHQSLPEPYFLQENLIDDQHISGLLRMRHSESTGIIRGDDMKKCNNGIFIEIYPLDYVPDHKTARKIQLKLSYWLMHALSAYYYNYHESVKQRLGKQFVHLFGYNRVYKWWKNVCTHYQGKDKKMVNLVTMPHYGITNDMLISAKEITDVVPCRYEYTNAYVTKSYDKLLRRTYGDYMQFPEEKERGKHHDQIVFYDPDVCYKDYINSDLVYKYFHTNEEVDHVAWRL